MENVSHTRSLYRIASDFEKLLYDTYGEIPSFLDRPSQPTPHEKETERIVRPCLELFDQLFQGQKPPSNVQKLLKMSLPDKDISPSDVQRPVESNKASEAIHYKELNETTKRKENTGELEASVRRRTRRRKQTPLINGQNNGKLLDVENNSLKPSSPLAEVPSWKMSLDAFAEALFCVELDLDVFRNQFVEGFPSNPSPSEEQKANLSIEKQPSPLKSFPGLVRGTQLMYLATDARDPFGLAMANKISMDWPICPQELLQGVCQRPFCRFQHKRDYHLTLMEQCRHAQTVGQSDREQWSGNPDASFLHWPIPSQIKKTPYDDIPLIKGQGSQRTASESESRSCLMRTMDWHLDELKFRSIQLSMDYSMMDWTQRFAPSEPSNRGGSPKDSSEVQNAKDVLTLALSLIDEDQILDSVSRQRATRFLSNKLTIFPHHRMLWQLYLGLLFRDRNESLSSKMYQAQLCLSMCGTWYRRSLMVAAIQSTPQEKIKTFVETLMALVHDPDPSHKPIDITVCCLDLILRVIYIELATQEAPFRQGTVGLSLVSAMKSSVQQNRNATSSEKDWMAQLLALLSQDCEACYVFCLSIIHAFLYGRLPTEIIHKFGFPKTCSVLNWKPTNLNMSMVGEVQMMLTWASHGKISNGCLDSKRKPRTLPFRQVLVANALLLMKLCDPKGAVRRLQCIFDVPEITRTATNSPFVFLELAKGLDRSLEEHGHVDAAANHHGHGFVLEQMILHYTQHHRVELVQDWIQTTEFRDLSQRVLLAVSKSKFYKTRTGNSLYLLASVLATTFVEERGISLGSEDFTESERFFGYLASFFNCVLNQLPVDVATFVALLSETVQNNRFLTKRFMKEILLLAGASLPRNDPRKKVPVSETAFGNEVPFSEMKQYLKDRQSAFASLLVLIEKFSALQVTSFEALDNFCEDLNALSNKVRSFLAPPKTHDLSVLLDPLRVLVPQLRPHEIMKIVEFLYKSFPFSPDLADFLVDIFPFLHNYTRAGLRILISVLFHSVPCASYHVWKQAVDIGSRYGTFLERELKAYAETVYPGWTRFGS